MKHIPVLLDSVMQALGNIKGKKIVDATFGAGGYSREMLTEFKGNFEFIPSSFSGIAELPEVYDAIVFDLGISSMQIDVPERGFSFRWDGPLDMRMAGVGMSAFDLIKNSSVEDLVSILKNYGDVKKAGVLAKAIKAKLPKTTFELKELIHDQRDVAPVFQALRIAVNDEMGELTRALAVVPEKLNVGGKCICVTFHSIEDRIVKNTFRQWTTPSGDPRLPVLTEAAFIKIKTATPSDEELEKNMRARSAHMRGVIKSY